MASYGLAESKARVHAELGADQQRREQELRVSEARVRVSQGAAHLQ